MRVFRYSKYKSIYHTKKLLEVNLHDIRKNTNPICRKFEVHVFQLFDFKHGHIEIFQNLLDKVPLDIFYLTFDGRLLWINEISRT